MCHVNSPFCIYLFPTQLHQEVFFFKTSSFSKTDQRDISKEPIKSQDFCKSALDLILSFRSVPYHKLHYNGHCFFHQVHKARQLPSAPILLAVFLLTRL